MLRIKYLYLVSYHRSPRVSTISTLNNFTVTLRWRCFGCVIVGSAPELKVRRRRHFYGSSPLTHGKNPFQHVSSNRIEQIARVFPATIVLFASILLSPDGKRIQLTINRVHYLFKET